MYMTGYMAMYISYLCVCECIMSFQYSGFHAYSALVLHMFVLHLFVLMSLANLCSAIFRCICKIAKTKVLALLCVSICRPVCMEQLGSHWMNFHEI